MKMNVECLRRTTGGDGSVCIEQMTMKMERLGNTSLRMMYSSGIGTKLDGRLASPSGQKVVS